MSGYPSIKISHDQRLSSPPRYPPFSASVPMAIPKAHDRVPPPLPPPQFIPEIATGRDPGWQWGNDPNGSDFGRPASVKPGSSLLGGAFSRRPSTQEKEHDFSYISSGNARRGSSISTVTMYRDNDAAEAARVRPMDETILSKSASNYRLEGERQLGQRSLEESSNTYDKHLLSRIGGPNAPKRTSISHDVSGAPQVGVIDNERRNSQLRPLAMPEQQTTLSSPVSARWPSSGAISPGFTGFWPEHGPLCNTSRVQQQGVSARHASLTDDSASQRGTYDQSMFMHDDLIEERQMRHLNIYDRSPGSSDDFQLGAGAGIKRRASSPPRDLLKGERFAVSSASGPGEIYHRRSIQTLPTRGSPISRVHPHHSSLSSASSYGPRQNSFGSSLGIASIPSSATSYGSGGRLSPSALSLPFDPDYRISAPKSSSSAYSPNTSHQRTPSGSTQGGVPKSPIDSASESRNSSICHPHGVYVCECCPKKPRKFESEDELRLHESEKQYTCAYCPNRFKNKNEAERHQNSLHLRRHSWCCAALAGVEAAFHTSNTGSNTDACGYCGEEFTNPPQWDVRQEHLNQVHKFGECNQGKKFFRADHFRQHLKHSHAGTSGKWTNMLEIACMKDEPLPEKRAAAASSKQQAPPKLMISTTPPEVSAGESTDRG